MRWHRMNTDILCRRFFEYVCGGDRVDRGLSFRTIDTPQYNPDSAPTPQSASFAKPKALYFQPKSFSHIS